MNIVAIQGNLTTDGEKFITSKGNVIYTNSIAIDQGSSSAVFIKIKAFDKKAEFLAAHASKGSRVTISGRLGMNEYKDNKSNEIVVIINEGNIESRYVDFNPNCRIVNQMTNNYNNQWQMNNGYNPNQGQMNNGYINQGQMNNGYNPSQGQMNNGYNPNQGQMNNGYNPNQGQMNNSYINPNQINNNQQDNQNNIQNSNINESNKVDDLEEVPNDENNPFMAL